MDFRFTGLDTPIIHALSHFLDADDFTTPSATDKSTTGSTAPSNAYVRDARAMARTPADVKEYPNSYKFIIDMPGLKSGDIKVQVEDDNVLVISGERKREEEKDGVKYLRMERRIGKFMRKFVLPENANMEKISAVCQDGVLTVSVEKLPPPEPKKPKTIEVKVA
ncbi:17.3 kDa class II heat shock protein-like [Chenopodium quinoa]|uniref:SHSP domain-containing protein n=1 Tax=Chenopodium quinoa TaxID=63459 RepID=A0A803LB63_CHEQI|nr:17.3 kDa class II heat shock protein-like [Chenopodium quinoa]